ncbi:MAG TPA: hypothetical protein VK797_07305 [Tepidisphaeraceae bacterium]|jgi:hypothetical protein|nr:hypothetical protein [Tepidisphaeraceae bacterium]
MTSKFVSPEHLACRLGLPLSFVKREAKAHRIPFITVNNMIRFSPELVERVLLDRSLEDMRKLAESASDQTPA